MEHRLHSTGAAGLEAGWGGLREGRQEAAEALWGRQEPWASQLLISAECVLRSEKHSVLCGHRS